MNGFRPDGTPVGNLTRIGQYPASPVFWNSTGYLKLPQLEQGGNAVTGNSEFIFGQSFTVTIGIGITRVAATTWDPTGAHIITGLTGIDSFASDVNSHGVFLGGTTDSSNPTDFQFGAFIGRNGSATRLNFPGFPEPRGFEINDDGWFTGVYEPQFAQQRGYLARHDLDTGAQEIYDLGIFPGYGETWAYAINNDRTIVGGAQQLGGDFDKALIWFNGSLVPQDLNLFVDIPGATLIDAYRINNAGQILAEARLDGGGFAYYRLDPIPEPSVMMLISISPIALLARYRK